MPFEPLRTDEQLDAPAPAERDFDSQMMAGCGQFVVLSLALYGFAAWPHFVFSGIHEMRVLAVDSLLGLLPSLAMGTASTRRFGLPSAAGFLGGALAVGIFLYLRLQQIHIVSAAREAPQPDWPRQWIWMLPGAWLAVVLLAIAVALRKEEWSWSDSPPPSAG